MPYNNILVNNLSLVIYLVLDIHVWNYRTYARGMKETNIDKLILNKYAK